MKPFAYIAMTAAAIAVVFIIFNKPSADGACRTFTDLAAARRTPTEVCTLDVGGQGLTGALPAEIRHMVNMKALDASDNDFTGIPAEIGQLANLRTADFSNNDLDTYPNELGNLRSLETLDLSGNRYSDEKLAEIQQLLPNTTIVNR